MDHTSIIDITMPGDSRTKETEREDMKKQETYKDIKIGIKLQMSSANFLLEHQEAVASLEKNLRMLNIEKREVDRVQLSALLRGARILRKVQDLSG